MMDLDELEELRNEAAEEFRAEFGEVDAPPAAARMEVEEW